MKLLSSFIFSIMLIAGRIISADTISSVNPIPETTTTTTIQTITASNTTTVQTTTVTNTTMQTTTVANTTTSQQPNITTVYPTTTNLPTTSSTEAPTTTIITTTIKPITNTTTVKPITNTTTVKPITNTTTIKPITTTVKPFVNTTTAKPITSTTVKPITSTTVKPTAISSPDTPTTSSKPTTAPPVITTKSPEPPTPTEGSWNVTEGNLTCIRAVLKARFRIPVQDHVEYIVLNPKATSSGSCKLSDTTQNLQLEESDYTLTMIFEKDSNNVYLKNVTFTYTLPDSSGILCNDDKLFSVKIGNSYKCDSSNNINLKNVTMEVLSIHIQAFLSVENKDFGTAEECAADNKVNDSVPAAIGIVLLVLVVVVLVAYFVERRRSSQKGYRSV